jgi:uncharacterized membrane protein
MVVLGQHRLLQREGVRAVMAVVVVVVVLLTAVVLGLTVVPVVAMIGGMMLIIGMTVGQQTDLHLLGPAPTRCTHS